MAMPHKKRSVGEASRMLAEYEALNDDLPRDTRTQLAVFVLARKVGLRVLNELFRRDLGQTPIRHRSWMWYNAMRFSMMEHMWDQFERDYNETGCLHHALRALKNRATLTQWRLFSQRLGIPIFKKERDTLNPWWWKCNEPHEPGVLLWTRGGVWDRRNNFTRIIMLGESFEREPFENSVSSALSTSDLRMLEREVHGLFDSHRLLVPDAIRQACKYVKTRIPEILGYKRDETSWHIVSWFFQTPVPVDGGHFIDYTDDVDWSHHITKHGRDHFIDWIPPLRDAS